MEHVNLPAGSASRPRQSDKLSRTSRPWALGEADNRAPGGRGRDHVLRCRDIWRGRSEVITGRVSSCKSRRRGLVLATKVHGQTDAE